jgi:amino acid transporter
MNINDSKPKPDFMERVRRRFIGAPRDINEPSLFHKISLIPLLAWIGLGADGLSSSSYGPEEAFKALGPHTYLAIFIAIATAFTVFIIAYAYSRIIEHFPHGGGGYIVATHTISGQAGVIAGSALLVDYVLTITVSLAACGDAIFSFLPHAFLYYKLPFVVGLIILLVIMNLRGVKESITFLAPIFIVFVITHVLLIGYGIGTHLSDIGPVLEKYRGSLNSDLSTIGFVGILAIFLRAFSMGGGTYTGIEAVSNAMNVMREPRVQTGKRTMVYLAVSLAVTASGLLFCYALFSIAPAEGRTLNAILADRTFSGWYLGGTLALITILSEGALLMVGAQAGFIDGPRVMANMAVDSWLPRRFSALSERLTMQNGVLLMGATSLAVLFYTHGSVSALVVMYSINVFLTFSLSQFGMAKFFFQNRHKDNNWARHIVIHLIGLILCVTILIVTVYEKFGEGGWVTLVITSALIGLCYLIRRHYRKVQKGVRQLEEILSSIPSGHVPNEEPLNTNERTAIILVSGYNGFGLHSWLSIFKEFPKLYRNFIFVSVAEIDSGAFKGASEIEALRSSTAEQLAKYVKLARSYGYAADYRMDVGTDVVEVATNLCHNIVQEFPKSSVFTGKLVFRQDNPFQRILHNETANAIQRRLQWEGITTVILPVRVNL